MDTKRAPMSPGEYGRWLATKTPPITDAQAEVAARILAGVIRDRARAPAA